PAAAPLAAVARVPRPCAGAETPAPRARAGSGRQSPRRRPIMTYALWIVQGLLALLFLFAGGVKLVLPLEELTKQMPLPGPFVRFIGVAEVLGAIGLILPGLLRIRPGLTPLAAAGLVIIMIGATLVTLATQGAAPAALPFCVGILAATVALGRRRFLEQARYETVIAMS